MSGGLGGAPLSARRDGDHAPSPSRLGCVREPDGTHAVVAVVKRTYALRLEPTPRLELADVEEPIREWMDVDAATGELRDDCDMLPQKRATDVVLRGSAHAGAPSKEIMIALAVGDVARQLRVVGERRVEMKGDTPSFTSPEPFESVELGDAVAYGGYDEHAQDALEPVSDEVQAQWQRKPRGLYQYARNPAGRAWFVDVAPHGSAGAGRDRARADGAKLPLVEDPGDLLTPARLFAPSAMRWIDAPMPGRLGWLHPARYPRLVRAAQSLLRHDDPERPIRESTFADGDDLLGLRELKWSRPMPRLLQGASPGLACERLRGDELVILKHLHPRTPEVRFNLPGEAPRLTVRPPGVRALSLDAALVTLRIEPDEGRVSLVWCGSLPAVAAVSRDQIGTFALDVSWSRLLT
jgi:hypothetical protein